MEKSPLYASDEIVYNMVAMIVPPAPIDSKMFDTSDATAAYLAHGTKPSEISKVRAIRRSAHSFAEMIRNGVQNFVEKTKPFFLTTQPKHCLVLQSRNARTSRG